MERIDHIWHAETVTVAAGGSSTQFFRAPADYLIVTSESELIEISWLSHYTWEAGGNEDPAIPMFTANELRLTLGPAVDVKRVSLNNPTAGAINVHFLWRS